MPSATSVPLRSKQAASSKSGIVTTENGERHIPSSTRADGSVRKEIRVRPGYRPPEDVEVYKNRTAEAWKNRGKGTGVPGADFVDVLASKIKSSNGKPKQAPSTTKPATTATATMMEKQANTSEADSAKKEEVEKKEEEVQDPEALKEKEARKLSKKLRQARDLEQKKEKGDSLLPEQFEKIIRINELIRQLDNLGFDAEGQKKEKA